MPHQVGGMRGKMQITDVRVRKITKEGKMRAIVSITLDDEFVIHDIKVIEGDKGLFIAMPSKRQRMGNTEISPIRLTRKPGKKSRKIILERYEDAAAEPE